MSQGWRRIDKNMLQSASMETGGFGSFRYIILPLMAGTMLLAFGICFVLCLCEFTTFHLASIRTIGTELAVLYQLTGSEAVVARAAWPVVIAAVIVAVVLTNMLKTKLDTDSAIDDLHFEARSWQYIFLVILFVVSFAVPVFVLLSSITNLDALKQFFKLHLDDTSWTVLTCAVAAFLAYLIAGGVYLLEKMGRRGRWLFLAASIIIIAAMLVPATLTAVVISKILAVYNMRTGCGKVF